MNKPKKIRFGVIGCSRVALKGMLPAMVDSAFIELVIIGSRDAEKAKEVAGRFGAHKWGTYEDVLRDKDIDTVYVSLPNALHEEWAVRALEAGKHVICEKPAAISYAAAERMVAAARKNNKRILEGFMFRYHPQHGVVREFIEKGTLGNVIRFEGCFGYAMPDFSSNAMSKELAGGSFNDQMPYPVYSSRMIFGDEPESVFCDIETDAQGGVSTRANMVLNYSGGRKAFATSIFGSYYQSTYSVLGTKAGVRMGRAYAVPRDMQTKIFLDADDRVQEIIVKPADHFRIMLDDFCGEVLKDGASTAQYEEDILNQALVLEAARVSNEEKRLVSLSEFSKSDNKKSFSVRALPQGIFKNILLTGGSGNLGRAIIRSGVLPDVMVPSHGELDITKKDVVARFFEEHDVDAVIHSAAVVKMSESENEPWKQQAIETNIVGTCNLVEEVLKREKQGKKIRFIYISTDGVYPGTKGNYREDDPTVPYNNYGWTKLGGESVVNLLTDFCIIRTSFFDPSHIPFETSATDMYASKMSVYDLPKDIKLILQSNFTGTINVGDRRSSYYDRYRECKPSLRPTTFAEVLKNVPIRMAKDASLNTGLWKEIKKKLEEKSA